jgi:hypothetical protein
MDRLSQLRVVDPVLTEIARGYENAEFVSELLFPVAPMSKEAGKIPQFGKEAFKIYNTERALRAKSNRVSPEGRSTIDVVLEEHDLEYPVDYREAEEDMFNAEENATLVATGGIQLRREKMAADLARNAANYAASNKITLAGASQFTDAASDPIGVIETGKEAVRAKIAKRPNVMIMGAASYKTLKDHGKLLERIKYSQTGVVTVDLMKAIFGIPNIAVGEAVSSDDAGVLSDVWGDDIVLAYVPQLDKSKRSRFNPSYGYTLRKRGQPVVDKYDESGKVRLVRSTDLFKVVQVGAEAGYLIKDTNA